MAKRKARGGGKKGEGVAGNAGKSPSSPLDAIERRRRRSAARKAARKPARRKKRGRHARSGRAGEEATAPRVASGRRRAEDARASIAPRRTLDDGRHHPDAAFVARTWTAAARPPAPAEPSSTENRQVHAIDDAGGITGGDVDVDVEQAYFSGDEAPGGDNPTPDQDIVDDIGKRHRRRIPGQRGTARERQGRRSRQAPLGARSGVGGGLQREEVERIGSRVGRLRSAQVACELGTSSLSASSSRLLDHPQHLGHDGIDRLAPSCRRRWRRGPHRAARSIAVESRRSRSVRSVATSATAAGPPV